MPKINVEYTVNDEQHAWLEEMAQKYQLPDASKALRVLLDFANRDGDPEQMFEVIRCRRC